MPLKLVGGSGLVAPTTMHSAHRIVTDVIAALELARSLKHTPLLHGVLDNSREALEQAIIHMESSTPLPPSPPPEVVKGNYPNFISSILPSLKKLNPNRSHRLNFTDAARLWKANRHLGDADAILLAAQAQANQEATDVCPQLIAESEEE